MKEQVEINGTTYNFKGWRIPPDYELPSIFKTGQYELDPEAMFESEDGELIGLHPNNLLLQEE